MESSYAPVAIVATMRVLILKPHELADPGLVGEAFRARGADLHEHVLADAGPPPPLDGFDAIVVMGAPWSVYGDEVRDWIGSLLDRLREAADRAVPVLGICFGAQAFAEAAGGWVARARDTEVGLHQVETVDEAALPAGPWFMWHGDTFGPPPGASVLAATTNGPQAYTLGPHLLVQFHPEATADIVAAWVAYDDADFRSASLDPMDTVEALRADENAARERAHRLVAAFLEGV